MILPTQNAGNMRVRLSKSSTLDSVLELHNRAIYSTSNQSNDTDVFSFNDGNLVAYARKRKCSVGETSRYRWGNISFASCTKNCCDVVTKRLCDPEGQNCRTFESLENCSDENCGWAIGKVFSP